MEASLCTVLQAVDLPAAGAHWPILSEYGRSSGTLTDAQLKTLLDSGESDRIERKSALTDKDKVRQAICAFANDLPGHSQPGVIFIGVRVGLRRAQATQEEERLLANVSVATDVTAMHAKQQKPDYPIVALRQLTRNAVLHRNYETSRAPIRIYWFRGQVTPESIGQPGVTDYRNPLVAEVMKNLGFVQRFGMGFELARREMAKNGNPALQIEATDTHVLCILRTRK